MYRKVTALLITVAAVAAFASTASAASTRSSCSDWGFTSKHDRVVSQVNQGLDFMELESFKAAEAWSLRGWQTLRATSPCRSTYRRWRTYELNAAASIWRAARAWRSNNLDRVQDLLDDASRWTDRAAAEEATWG